MYLIILDYGTDAERKRIDYAVERWQDKLVIKKPKGTILIVSGSKEQLNDFIEDLHARLESPEKKMQVFDIEYYIPEVEKKTKTLVYRTKEKIEFVKRFMDYLMTKLNANYEYRSKIGKVYSISTKKGQAKLETIVRDIDGKTEIRIGIEGYGEVVSFLSDKIDNEMKMFLGER